MPERTYNAISLFSGAMGLDIGLLKTMRFKLLACVEKERVFCDTIRENISKKTFPENPKVYEEDIKDLSPNRLLEDLGIASGDLDLLVGGPPCQSFSTAGKRGTVQDPRGTLLWDFLRFVKLLKPKIFLMENVRGLMSAALRHRPIALRPEKGGTPLSPNEAPGSVVQLFAEDLSKMDGATYHMDCFEVNAVNYGAPQLRERALFIGNRFNEEINFPNPTHGKPQTGNCQLELIPGITGSIQPWQTLRDAIRDINEEHPTILDFSPRKLKYLSLVPPGGNWRHLPEALQRKSMGKAFMAKGGRSGWWRRLTYDLPCPTLVTMPNHASTALCHPEKVRALTLKEYCRIQEFPDDWIVCGSPSQQYAQIGNAVPVRLGEVAGNVIIQILDKLAGRGWQPSPEPAKECRKIYIQSHVRTRQWFKKGKAFQWKDGKDNSGITYSTPKKHRSWAVMEGQ